MAKIEVELQAKDTISKGLARMSRERSWGVFSVVMGLFYDRYFREVDETQVWRERYLFLCVGFGAKLQDLERHEQIVGSFAEQTFLPNMVVWRAGWEMVYDGLGQCKPVIPDDVQAWADELWARATGWDLVIEALTGRRRGKVQCPQLS